ncbi:hypothetical protein [Desertivirga brevis]|uniref:hypothetical protein n=1 Tax=Desertivirga brevis TaxID=2810310 RepID=UPI001A96757F|nr:hypothetical protein [Pedobacter sp. SYSU D00873]
MKVLAIFMTILMLITGVDLCNDLDSYERNVRKEVGQADNGKHPDEKPCSPFCHCARCPFSVILPSILNVLNISFIKSEKYEAYSVTYSIQFAVSIWQPPKAA